MERSRRCERGLTLIEMLAALAVLAIVAGLSTGSWQSMVGKLRLQSVAQELAADVQLARSTAVAQHRAVRLEVHPHATGSCILAYTGAAGSCHCDEQGQAQCAAPEQVVQRHWLPAGEGVRISANVASMRFDPVVGTVSPTGTLTTSLVDGRSLAQVVNVMGRSRTCSPQGTVSGIAVC
jgi:type IV fimbrial biogenesis protein FimT